jgi:hypothetical protein
LSPYYFQIGLWWRIANLEQKGCFRVAGPLESRMHLWFHREQHKLKNLWSLNLPQYPITSFGIQWRYLGDLLDNHHHAVILTSITVHACSNWTIVNRGFRWWTLVFIITGRLGENLLNKIRLFERQLRKPRYCKSLKICNPPRDDQMNWKSIVSELLKEGN